MRERLYLFDTTLRDGAQTNGVDFTLTDKLAIIRMLDELGIDYVEGGYPGANPTDTQLFAEPRMLHTTFTAFGMTRRPGRSTSNDPGLAALLEPRPRRSALSPSPGTITSASRSRPRSRKTSPRSATACRAAKAKGREVLLDCEHFFDGYKANPAYALACAKTAYEEGARWVVLCDTNGGTLPHEVEAIVREVVKNIPGDHRRHPRPQRHRAGGGEFVCRRPRRRPPDPGHAQRPRRALRQRQSRLDHPDAEAQAGICRGVRDRRLRRQAEEPRCTSRTRSTSGSTAAPNRHAPYVGESAFATKAGIHASAIMKDPATYEHVAPEAVGNRRKLLVSDQAGRSNVLAELERIGLKVDKNDQRVARLLDEVKEREAIGYAYETRRRVVRAAGAPHARHGAEILRRELFRRQGRAARPERQRRRGADHRRGQGQDRRRDADLRRRRQRPGQRARRRAAQGPRQVPEVHRGAEAHRLSRAYPQLPAPKR